jgi:VWFA-related protein
LRSRTTERDARSDVWTALARSRAAVSVLAIAAIASGAARQAQQPKPVFRARADLVYLDVSVLDQKRNPVRGLHAAEFVLLEDGRPQPVAVFSAIDVQPAAAALPARWIRDVSPDVQTNEQNTQGRLFVLVIDDALLPPDLPALQSAKKIARGIIERLSTGDRAAVVFSRASQNAQNFTTDRTKLFAAVDSLQAGSARHVLGWDSAPVSPGRRSGTGPTFDSDAELRLASLDTLKAVADALLAVPERRKSLIFIRRRRSIIGSRPAVLLGRQILRVTRRHSTWTS